MKLTLLLALANLLWSVAAVAATIIDLSITRSVFADAQAGGATIEAISSTTPGFFNEQRTDSDASAGRSAKVTSFQSTNVAFTGDTLEFSGAAYTRSFADGGSVSATGRSETDIVFTTTDNLFTYTISATFVLSDSVEKEAGNSDSVSLYRIVNGFANRVNSIEHYPGDANPQSRSMTGTILPGRYRLSLKVGTQLSFGEFAPQADDVTSSAYAVRAVLVPEPCTVGLLFAGLLWVTGRCARGNTARKTAFACCNHEG